VTKSALTVKMDTERWLIPMSPKSAVNARKAFSWKNRTACLALRTATHAATFTLVKSVIHLLWSRYKERIKPSACFNAELKSGLTMLLTNVTRAMTIAMIAKMEITVTDAQLGLPARLNPVFASRVLQRHS